MKNLFLYLGLFLCLKVFAEECKNRGNLDVLFCDENKDLIADTPKDITKLKNPKTLVFTFPAVDNPAIYKEVFTPFTNYLSQCTGKKVMFYEIQNSTAEVEAMRSGKLHIGGFTNGALLYATHLSGAVPFAAEGYEDGSLRPYRLIVIVKKDSKFQKLTDLKGTKFAHTSPSSNVGHMTPLAFFPNEGLIPGQDYDILFSGKYDQSIMGVSSGDYDAAVVISDVFERMIERGQIKQNDFKIIYESQNFPPGPYTLSHNLEPKLQDKIKECFFKFRFTKEMKEVFDNADRFVSIDWLKDYKVVRDVAEKNNLKFTRETLGK